NADGTTAGVATVGDVITAVNSGFFTVNANGSKAADIKFGDTLNFANGTGTTAVVKDGGVAYNTNVDGSTIVVDDATNSLKVNTSALPKTVVQAGTGPVEVSGTGAADNPYTVSVTTTTVTDAADKATTGAVGTAADADAVLTAENVVNLVKDAGFKLTASENGGAEKDSTVESEVIKPGSTVDMAAGKNLVVKQEANGKITYATADDVTFNNVTTSNLTATGNTTVNNFTVNSGATIDMGNNVITNVANGTNDNDAVNLSQLNATRTVVAAGDNTHVKTSDLAGGGTTYTVHADKAVVSQGDGVTITPEEQTDQTTGTVTTTYNVALSQDTKNKLDRVETVVAGDSGLVTVDDSAVNTSGGKEFKVDITKGAFNGVTTAGKLNADGTTAGVATVGDVITAVNSGFFTVNANGSKAADIKFGDTLNFANGTGTTAVVKDGGVAYNTNVDGSTIVVDDATNSLKVNTSALPKTVVAQGNNTVVSSETVGTTTTYKVDAEKTTVSKAATSPITVTEGIKSATGVTNYEVGLSID
ncbi:hypothetical protein B0680_10515, partial [Moraxella pluranimalium]